MNVYKIDLITADGGDSDTPYEIIHVAAIDIADAFRKAREYIVDGDYFNIEVGAIARVSITLAK